MHRIDGPTAAPGGMFTEGSPTGGLPATIVSDDWLNDVQENLMAVLAAASITPTKGRAADLLDAMQALFLGGSGLGGTSTSDYVSFKYKDKVSGVSRTFYLMWGTGVTNGSGIANVSFPLTFPNACLFAVPYSGTNLSAAYAQTGLSTSGANFPMFNSATGAPVSAGSQMYYLAGGY